MSPGMTPRFSFATMYDPPPPGYAAIVWRYDMTTIANSDAIAMAIGSESVIAIAPAAASTMRISSVA